MLRKALTYGAGLVALVIIVEHASGSGRVFTAGANGGTKFLRTLQGR